MNKSIVVIVMFVGLSGVFIEALSASQFGGIGDLSLGENHYFARARLYDSDTGVFLQKDPIGVSGDIISYRYCGGNPVNFTDRDGENMLIIVGADNTSIDSEKPEYYRFTGWANHAKAIGMQYEIENNSSLELLMGKYFGAKYNRAHIVKANSFQKMNAAIEAYGNIDSLIIIAHGFNGFSAFSLGKNRPEGNLTASEKHAKNGIGMLISDLLMPQFATDVIPYVELASCKCSGKAHVQALADVWSVPVYSYSGGVGFGPTPRILKTKNIADFKYLFLRGGERRPTEGYVPSTTKPFKTLTYPSQWPWIGEGVDTSLIGGVLIDFSASLVGSELSDLRGVTYDPKTNQLVFLGTDANNGANVDGLDMDYFFTAVQAVYGSAVPPFVSLDPAAKQISEWADFSDGDGVFEDGESGGFTMIYQPLWLSEGGDVALRFVLRDRATGEVYDASTPLEVWQSGAQISGDPIEQLIYRDIWENGNRHTATSNGLPAGVSLVTTPFQEGSIGFNLSWNDGDWQSHYPVRLINNSGREFDVISTNVIPSKQHRRFGGRVDGTKAGWVMFEADRIMKCLAIGYDPLTDTTYESASLAVPAYQNLLERAAANPTGSTGNIRMWFVPEEMKIKRHVDEASGRASMVFDSSKVSLLTEAALAGTVASPNAADFVSHFTANYQAFAGMEFPVLDPDDPTGQTLIQVKIFDMLEDVMQAVSLARFLRDNGVPLDMWWLNSWTPPAAFSPRSVPTAYNESESGGVWFSIHGGVNIPTPNTYVPSATAESVGLAVLAARPDDTVNPESDLDAQTWESNTVEGDLTAVAATANPESQDGNIVLGETDLAAASVGDLPLILSRFYQSSWLGKKNLGPGWRTARFQLQFSRPSWYDENRLMRTVNGSPLATNAKGDTGLRSGIIRVVDLASGGGIEFESTLLLDYGVDALNNPKIVVNGLQADKTPWFLTGSRQDDGSTLTQDPTTRNYIYTSAAGSVIEFDSEGKVLLTRDIRAIEQTYTYNAQTTLLDKIEDSEGQNIVFAYDAEQRLTAASLTMINAPFAAVVETVTYDYYTEGENIDCLKTVTDTRSGNSVEYRYNERCQLTEKVYFNGLKEFVATVDLKGRAESGEDSRGNVVQSTFQRDEATGDRITTTSDPLITAQSGFLPTQQRYDSSGRFLSGTSVTGLQTSFEYNGDEPWPSRIIMPIEGREPIEIERDALGNPTRITDPSNTGAQPVEMVYNGDYLLEDVFDEAGRKTEIRYTADRNVDYEQIYHNGQPLRVSYSYNQTTGYLESVTNAENETVSIGRDSKGRVTSVTDPTGVSMQFEYDAYGRIWKVYDPRTTQPIEYQYDDADRVAAVIAPNGTTSYNYNAATGFLDSVTDSLNRRTRYTYFANGDTQSVILEKLASDGTVLETLNQTDFAYDRFGNLTMVDPSGAAPIYFNTDELGRGTGSYEVDYRVPGAPKALDSNNADNGQWTNQDDHVFVWGAPESDSGIEGYSWSLNAAADEVIDGPDGTTSFTDVAEGQHVFHVKGKTNEAQSGDATVSFWSEETTFDLWVDITDPQLASVNLLPSDVTKATQGAVAIEVSASDSLSGIDPANPPRFRYALTAEGGTPSWTTFAPMTTGSNADEWTTAVNADWNAEKGKTLHYQVEVEDRAGNVVSSQKSELIEAGKAPFIFFTK